MELMEITTDVRKLRLMMDAIRDFISYVDANEHYVFVNKSYEKWLSRSSSELVGRSVREILGDSYAESEPYLHAALKKGKEVSYETTLAHPITGEMNMFDIRHIPNILENGQIDGVVTIIHDVTEKRRTQEDLEERVRQRTEEIRRSQSFLDSVIENIPNMIFVKDAADLKFVRFNKAGETLLGVPRQQLIGKSDYDLFPAEQAEFFVSNDREVLASRQLKDLPEEPIDTAGGRRFLHTKKLSIVGPDGRPEYLLGISEDITEKRAFEEQRLKALEAERLYREAQSINRTKDEFLATLSHELRTPLNVICGHAELLISEFGEAVPTELATSLQAIERNAKLQTQIIDDLLDLSSIIMGKIKFQPTPFSPAEFMRAQFEGAEKSAVEKGVKIKCEIEDNLDPIYADPIRLNQIIWNLLSNAIKFTSAGDTITIRVFRESDHYAFEVEDTGRGIDAAFLPYVFDRFRQEDTGYGRRYGGLGLGLSIVRQLTELHGGSVHVRSDGKDKGSLFTVKLPFRMGTNETQPPKTSSIQTQVLKNATRLSGVKVLLVEDSVDSRELVAKILSKAGALVTSVGSAAAARENLAKERPDVIVSDIGMPEEDGCAFISGLRQGERPMHVPAVALTAYVRSEEIELALKSGFQMHVPKPISSDVLIDAVANLIEA